jgi:hypothetical protein
VFPSSRVGEIEPGGAGRPRAACPVCGRVSSATLAVSFMSAGECGESEAEREGERYAQECLEDALVKVRSGVLRGRSTAGAGTR